MPRVLFGFPRNIKDLLDVDELLAEELKDDNGCFVGVVLTCDVDGSEASGAHVHQLQELG